MATKRKSTSKAKPKAAPKTPMSAQEKEARAATTAADNATLEAQGAVVGRQTKGAFTQRRLRMSGSDLARYIMPGGYEDDPGLYQTPKPPGGGGGGRPTTRTPAKPAKPKAPPRMKPVSHKKAVKQQTKMSDARGKSLDAARKKAKAKVHTKGVQSPAQRRAIIERAKQKAKYQPKPKPAPRPYVPSGGKAPLRV